MPLKVKDVDLLRVRNEIGLTVGAVQQFTDELDEYIHYVGVIFGISNLPKVPADFRNVLSFLKDLPGYSEAWQKYDDYQRQGTDTLREEILAPYIAMLEDFMLDLEPENFPLCNNEPGTRSVPDNFIGGLNASQGKHKTAAISYARALDKETGLLKGIVETIFNLLKFDTNIKLQIWQKFGLFKGLKTQEYLPTDGDKYKKWDSQIKRIDAAIKAISVSKCEKPKNPDPPLPPDKPEDEIEPPETVKPDPPDPREETPPGGSCCADLINAINALAKRSVDYKLIQKIARVEADYAIAKTIPWIRDTRIELKEARKDLKFVLRYGKETLQGIHNTRVELLEARRDVKTIIGKLGKLDLNNIFYMLQQIADQIKGEGRLSALRYKMMTVTLGMINVGLASGIASILGEIANSTASILESGNTAASIQQKALSLATTFTNQNITDSKTSILEKIEELKKFLDVDIVGFAFSFDRVEMTDKEKGDVEVQIDRQKKLPTPIDIKVVNPSNPTLPKLPPRVRPPVISPGDKVPSLPAPRKPLALPPARFLGTDEAGVERYEMRSYVGAIIIAEKATQIVVSRYGAVILAAAKDVIIDTVKNVIIEKVTGEIIGRANDFITRKVEDFFDLGGYTDTNNVPDKYTKIVPRKIKYQGKGLLGIKSMIEATHIILNDIQGDLSGSEFDTEELEVPIIKWKLDISYPLDKDKKRDYKKLPKEKVTVENRSFDLPQTPEYRKAIPYIELIKVQVPTGTKDLYYNLYEQKLDEFWFNYTNPNPVLMPDGFQYKPMQYRPQLQIATRGVNEKGIPQPDLRYVINVQHFDYKRLGIPKNPIIPKYKKGTIMGIMTLSDNSKNIIYGKDKKEVIRIMKALKAVTIPSFAANVIVESETKNNLTWHEVNLAPDGTPITEIDVEPLYAEYFEFGRLNRTWRTKPMWRVRWDGKPSLLPKQ